MKIIYDSSSLKTEGDLSLSDKLRSASFEIDKVRIDKFLFEQRQNILGVDSVRISVNPGLYYDTLSYNFQYGNMDGRKFVPNNRFFERRCSENLPSLDLN